jgi:hypothetical protein
MTLHEELIALADSEWRKASELGGKLTYEEERYRARHIAKAEAYRHAATMVGLTTHQARDARAGVPVAEEETSSDHRTRNLPSR